jgi:16S rRNA G527 N7-methylase RsmG
LLCFTLRQKGLSCTVLLSNIDYPALPGKITSDQVNKLDSYAQLLFSQAMPQGFIGDCTLDELYLRHVLDAILPAVSPETQATLPLSSTTALRVFDLGAGAGLPSLPLAILFPQHEFHLLDAQEKRCRFALAAAEELGLRNVNIYHSVVQNFAERTGVTTKADIVIFRAFRKVLTSLELALHVLENPRESAVADGNPKVLYWRSQAIPLSDEGNKRVADLGYTIDSFVKFESAAHLIPRGIYTFSRAMRQKAAFPRSWKKISADKLVETES